MFRQLFEAYLGHYSHKRSKALLGVTVGVVSYVWTRLQADPAPLQPVHLLWALYFLKHYPKTEVCCLVWHVSERTFRDHVWDTIFALDRQLEEIRLEDRLHDPLPGNAYLCVDTKGCPIQCHSMSWEEQKLWFDGHHRRHAIKYEVAVHAQTGMIHWVQGGVFGSVHDLALLRVGGILDEIQVGERLYGDKAYFTLRQAESHLILTPYKGATVNLTRRQIMWNLYFNAKRVIVENAIGRILRFDILRVPFRHGIQLHPIVFNVCSQLAAIDIRIHPLRRNEYENPHVRNLDPDDDDDIVDQGDQHRDDDNNDDE